MSIRSIFRNVLPALAVMFAGLFGAYMVYQGFYSDNMNAESVIALEPAAGEELGATLDTELDVNAVGETVATEAGQAWDSTKETTVEFVDETAEVIDDTVEATEDTVNEAITAIDIEGNTAAEDTELTTETSVKSETGTEDMSETAGAETDSVTTKDETAETAETGKTAETAADIEAAAGETATDTITETGKTLEESAESTDQKTVIDITESTE